MAGLKDKIEALRQQGATDEQLWNAVQKNSAYTQLIQNGATPEQVQKSLGLSPSEAEPGVESEAGRLGGIVGAGLLKGAASLAAVPGDIEQLAQNYLPTSVSNALSVADRYAPGLGALKGIASEAKNLFGIGSGELPTSTDVANVLSSAGLAGPTPANTAERYASGIAQGVGGAVPAMLTGGAAAAGELATAGALGGAGATLGQEIAPDNPLAAIGLGLLGGLGASGAKQQITKLLNAKAASNLSLKALSLDESLAATQKAHDDLADQLTNFRLDNREKMIQTAAEQKALTDQANATAQASIEAANSAAQSTASQTAKQLGGATSMEQAGVPLQTKVRSWVENDLPKAQEEIMAPVREAIPPGTTGTLDNFQGVLKAVNSDAGVLENINKVFKPKGPAQAQQSLQNYLKLKELDEGLPAPTWDNMKKIRTSIGDAIGNPKIVNDIGDQNLRALYSGITADMEQMAASVSPEALAAFREANAKYTKLMDFVQGPVADVVSSPRASAEGLAPIPVAERVLKSGAGNIAQLRSIAPDEISNLAAAAISKNRWSKLEPEVQQTLVPDESLRNTLNSALTNRDTIKTQATQQKNSVIQPGLANMVKMKQEQQLQQIELERQLSERKARLSEMRNEAALAREAAQNAAALSKGVKKEVLTSNMEKLVGLISGNQLGSLLAIAMPGLPDYTSNALALGLSLGPKIYQGAKATAKNPALLVNPAIGAQAGNALMAEPTVLPNPSPQAGTR